MKHPFIVTWDNENGQRRYSSFASEAKRNALAKTLAERGLNVWISDQLQLEIVGEPEHSSTYDPRYEIPF